VATLRLRFPVSVENGGVFPADALEFGLDERFADFVSARSEAALVALLIPAMERGCALTIEGNVTASLLKRCRVDAQYLIKRVVPDLALVDVECTGTLLPDTADPGDAVITGLSCGVDSLFTIAELLLDDRVPKPDRLTHFVLNDVGGSGRFASGDTAELHRLHQLHAASVADKLGLPLISVQSNMDLFYQKDFQQTHTPRNLSVAYLLSQRVRAFHYASTVSYEDVRAATNKDISVVDPILLPLLSTSRLRAASSGSAVRRIDKTRTISLLPIARSDLNICVNSTDDKHNFQCATVGGNLRVLHKNCGYCWKCARTLLALDFMQKLDGFSDAFLLENYRSVKPYFIAHAWARRRPDELNRELFELMAQEGVELSRGQWALNRVFVAAYSVIRLAPLPMLRRALSVIGKPAALNGGWTNERLWRKVVRLLVWSKRLTPRTLTPPRHS
jgi:hypothetical protein